MNTKIISKKIETAVKDENSTHRLANLVMEVAIENGKQMTSQEARNASIFVMEYIKFVPRFIEEGMNAAGKFGIRNEMNLMLNEIEQYWKEEKDLVPDNLGLIGITDDAYASLFLLQTLSDYCKSLTGKPLLAIDLTGVNNVIRNILGEQIASKLEQAVGVTISQNMVNQVFNQMYQTLFSSGFNFGALVNAQSSQREIDQQVNLQLGAMGIF
jgi:hypothetical protein